MSGRACLSLWQASTQQRGVDAPNLPSAAGGLQRAGDVHRCRGSAACMRRGQEDSSLRLCTSVCGRAKEQMFGPACTAGVLQQELHGRKWDKSLLCVGVHVHEGELLERDQVQPCTAYTDLQAGLSCCPPLGLGPQPGAVLTSLFGGKSERLLGARKPAGKVWDV